jgi:hypothetical protein
MDNNRGTGSGKAFIMDLIEQMKPESAKGTH